MRLFGLIKTDYHSVIHFLGCCFITQSLVAVGVSSTSSVSTSIAAGLIWECLDSCNRRLKWNLSFLDPAGFDLGDVVVDILGAFTGLLIVWGIMANG